MDFFNGHSVPGGHGVLAAMQLAATPVEEVLGRVEDWQNDPFAAFAHPDFSPVNHNLVPREHNDQDVFAQFLQQRHSSTFTRKRPLTDISKKEETRLRGLRGLGISQPSREEDPRTVAETDEPKLRDAEDGGESQFELKRKRGKFPAGDRGRSSPIKGSWLQKARKRLESKMFSKSTNATKEAKRRKIHDILVSIGLSIEPKGLSQSDILSVGAILGESGIKTGDQYLAELKLMQLEAGISWPDVLERQLVMVKRALKRDKGPDVRAKEVKLDSTSDENWEKITNQAGVPMRTAWSYAWAVIWMLRGIEAADIRLGDVKIHQNKTVTLLIRKSKTDQGAKGTKRTLKCCGLKTCARDCPWALATRAKADHVEQDSNLPLFPDAEGSHVSKVRMVKSWMDTLDSEMSGHSARRSGAMRYTRLGMSVYEVATLGRWKSSAVFRYVEEALEEVPMNERTKTQETEVQVVEPKKTSKRKDKRAENKDSSDATMKMPKAPEEFWAVSRYRSKAVGHRVRQASWNLELDRWATWCGWKFAERNVKVTLAPFLVKGVQKCKKCEAARKQRDKVNSGISLAQLVSLEDKSGNTANHEIKFQEEKILKSSNAAEAAKLQTSNQPNKKWCASGGWEGLIATLKLL